ncbi:MAG: MATE family efflux transporter [Candidatus Omnitrophota bacterium]
MINALKRRDLKAIIGESWSVCWPMTLILFFQFLIGLTDVFIAGKIGKEVQAAYGFVFHLYFVFTVIATAINVGTVSVASKLFTSGDKARFSNAIFTSIVATFTAGLIICAVAIVFSPILMRALHIPAALKEHGIPLIRIYSLGLIFHYVLINSNGILRASKMIKRSLFTMAVVCIINVPLDFFLVFRTDLGYKGIALATVISVAIGSLLNAAHLKGLMRYKKIFSLEQAKKIIGIGWPIGLLQVAWQLGTAAIFIILGFLPEKSIETIAAMTNGLRVESIIFLPAFAFNMANAVIVGNAIGSGETEEAYHRGLITATIGVAVVMVLTMIVALKARWALSFLSGNGIVINESVKYLYIVLISEPFMAWGVILGGGLSGAGDTRSVMKIVVSSFWFLRIPLSFIFGILLGRGAIAIWWAMNVSVFVQSIFISRRYLSKGWFHHA